jgi:hypothetical protein
VIAGIANEFTNLIDALAHEHFLKPDQIRLEALDPFPDEPCPFKPRTLVMPDIQSEDLQGHVSNLAVL